MSDPFIIHEINMFKDGGTYSLKTSWGDMCVDRRIDTFTKGRVYMGRHPSEGVLATLEEATALRDALGVYSGPFPLYASPQRVLETIIFL